MRRPVTCTIVVCNCCVATGILYERSASSLGGELDQCVCANNVNAQLETTIVENISKYTTGWVQFLSTDLSTDKSM